MDTIRIETDGLTLKEVRELEALLSSLDEVAEAKLWPFPPGTLQNRSLPPVQMGIGTLHVVIRLAEGAVMGIGGAAGTHIYKKIGEGLVDKAWDGIRARFSGKSSVEVGIKLYGPDGQIIKEHRDKR